MFKNLIRLRLLDFFELTAATAGALYVYQSSAWYISEKNWIISALSIAAVVIWMVARLGKSAPTPGLFLASYAGALYGLSDLSPWMIVLGRPTVTKLILNLFPDSMPIHSWQERLVTATVVAFLMMVPAVFWGCTWSAAWTLLQWVRKKLVQPLSFTAKAAIAARFTIAFTLATGVAYFYFRPQLRHVRTIRLSYKYESVEIGDAFPAEYSQAPCVKGWGFSQASNRLLILQSNKALTEFSLSDGAKLQEWKLSGDPYATKRKRRLTPERNADERAEDILSHFEDASLMVISATPFADRRYVLIGNSDWELYELLSQEGAPRGRRNRLPPGFKSDDIIAFSPNERFAITKDFDSGRFIPVRFSIWDLWSLQRTRRVEVDPSTVEGNRPLITNDGKHLKYRTTFLGDGGGCTLFLSGPPLLERFWRLREGMLTVERSKVSNDGTWILSDGQLTPANSTLNVLPDFHGAYVTATLEPRSNRLVCISEAQPRASERDFDGLLSISRVPILETLLEQSGASQFAIYDPVKQKLTTSWSNPNLLKSPKLDSLKFTENGRYLIIQDEDESADLFHVFSMP